MTNIKSIITQAASKQVRWKTLPSPQKSNHTPDHDLAPVSTPSGLGKLHARFLRDFGLHLGVMLMLAFILGTLATLGTPIIPSFTLLKVETGEGDARALLEIGLWGLCAQGVDTGDCHFSRAFGPSSFAGIDSNSLFESTRPFLGSLAQVNAKLTVAAQVAPIIFAIATFLTVNLFFCAAKAYRFKGCEDRWAHSLAATGVLWSVVWSLISCGLMIALASDIRKAIEGNGTDTQLKISTGSAQFMMHGAAIVSAWVLGVFVYWRCAEKRELLGVSLFKRDNNSVEALRAQTDTLIDGKAKAEEAAAGKIDLERQNSFASVSTLPVYEVSREASAQP